LRLYNQRFCSESFPGNLRRPFLKLPHASSLLLLASCVTIAAAQPVPVHHLEGREHGFLLLRDEAGHAIGSGEVTQEAAGDRVTYHMVFRFHDGSIDDETTVYSQRGKFELISDHHIQRGPFFSTPLDLTTTANGQMTSRSEDKAGSPGKMKEEVSQQNLEPGTAVDGMMCGILSNVDPHVAPFKLPILSPTRKPRFFHFDVSSDGKGSFSIVGLRRTATIFRLHTDLGGLAGVVAPLIGKEPKDILVWVLEEGAPTVVRVVGPLSEGGPVVDVQFAGATFPRPASH
jgi:hypothetical protein